MKTAVEMSFWRLSVSIILETVCHLKSKGGVTIKMVVVVTAFGKRRNLLGGVQNKF